MSSPLDTADADSEREHDTLPRVEQVQIFSSVTKFPRHTPVEVNCRRRSRPASYVLVVERLPVCLATSAHILRVELILLRPQNLATTPRAKKLFESLLDPDRYVLLQCPQVFMATSQRS